MRGEFTMKNITKVFMAAMFAIMIGIVYMPNAEARTDVYVTSSPKESFYIDTDSARLLAHKSGKGVDNQYIIYAEFHTNTGRFVSDTWTVNYAGNHIEVWSKTLGRNVYPLGGISGYMFTSAWYYAMGYPFS